MSLLEDDVTDRSCSRDDWFSLLIHFAHLVADLMIFVFMENQSRDILTITSISFISSNIFDEKNGMIFKIC